MNTPAKSTASASQSVRRNRVSITLSEDLAESDLSNLPNAENALEEIIPFFDRFPRLFFWLLDTCGVGVNRGDFMIS